MGRPLASRVSFGVQSNRLDDEIDPIASILWRFASSLSGNYCADIDMFAIILRVNGECGSFGSPGADRIQVQPRYRRAGMDIVVGEGDIGECVTSTLERILRYIETGWEMLIDRIARRGLSFDEQRLWMEWRDFRALALESAKS